MTKPISTRAHGVLDYLSAGTLLALPQLLGWTPKLTTILTGSALVTVTASLLTSYELGVVKAIPMRGHLALDAATAAGHAAVPFLLLDARERRSGTALPILLGFAAFEAAVAALTRPAPAERSCRYGGWVARAVGVTRRWRAH